jgi:hypothetical protein
MIVLQGDDMLLHPTVHMLCTHAHIRLRRGVATVKL